MNNRIMLIISFWLGFFIPCYGQKIKAVNKQTVGHTSSNDSVIIPTDSKQFYFPLGVFKDSTSYPGQDTSYNGWYSRNLFVMREPILYSDPSQKEVYRFIWLRSFDNPIAIRIERWGSSYLISWKLSDGEAGFQPGVLTVNKHKAIDKITWDKFQILLGQSNFWKLKTIDKTILGSDGSRWVLEGKKYKHYHCSR